MFEKLVAVDPSASYADLGAAIQVFVCDDFCELESLGTLKRSRRATWRVTANDGASPASETTDEPRPGARCLDDGHEGRGPRPGRCRARRGLSRVHVGTPRPLWSEQDPQLWWDGAVHAIAGLLDAERRSARTWRPSDSPARCTASSRSTATTGSCVPAILWNDQRTEIECDLIRETIGRERLIATTGNDALPGFTAPKLLWVQRNEPDVWFEIAHILLPKDFVRLRLTGDHAVDRADGAGTLLFDLAARDWSDEVIDALGIDRAWLPPTYEGTATTGAISAEAADATGLRAGTPVVAGGGDQAAAAVGVGAVEPGVVSLSLGTSGVVFASTDGPLIDPEGRLHSFCHAVPGRWHVMGVMLSAAGSLRWFRDSLAPGVDFSTLVDEAGDVPPGSDGLLFLPYLSGERTPYPDPLARGAFIGLTAHHGRPHMTRSVLEGVAFGLRDSLELMRSVGLGGFERSG